MRKASVLIMILACFGLVFAACGDDSESSSDADSTNSTVDDADSTSSSTASDENAADDDVEQDGATTTAADGTTDSATDGDDEDGVFPVTVPSGDATLTIDAKPMAIVSLSPTSTEMLFAIGAGDQVIAVDEASDYPAEAPVTDLSGYEPNIEAILSYGPDLVVASSAAIADGLEAAGVPLLVQSAVDDFDGMYEEIEQLGAVTGHVGDAAELVAQMQADIDEIVAKVPETDETLTYFHELDNTLYTVTSDTFIGEVYSLFDLENIADAADPNGEFGGYPQVSTELILDENPDLIFLADTKCCDETPETVADRDGWEDLRSVQNGDVVELDDDVASRWGPRVVDFVGDVADAVTTVRARATAAE